MSSRLMATVCLICAELGILCQTWNTSLPCATSLLAQQEAGHAGPLLPSLAQPKRGVRVGVCHLSGPGRDGIVCARIAEIVLSDERAVIPIGSYQKDFGVTLSLPSVLGRRGIVEVLEPEMSDEERRGLSKSAESL